MPATPGGGYLSSAGADDSRRSEGDTPETAHGNTTRHVTGLLVICGAVFLQRSDAFLAAILMRSIRARVGAASVLTKSSAEVPGRCRHREWQHSEN